jgi:hypothetical protein
MWWFPQNTTLRNHIRFRLWKRQHLPPLLHTGFSQNTDVLSKSTSCLYYFIGLIKKIKYLNFIYFLQKFQIIYLLFRLNPNLFEGDMVDTIEEALWAATEEYQRSLLER